MKNGCYYNENNAFHAQWIRNLVAAGLVPAGDVDERDIRDVHASDISGYVQCHFFAGLGGWAYAARLAGWPDDRRLWTGSCPCQPWSIAGNQRGVADDRHLWPDWYRLIRACRPACVMGEQVKDAARQGWLDDVADGMDAIGYAFRPVVFPAVAVGAFHRRDRIYFVADTSGAGLPGAECQRWGQPGPASSEIRQATTERDRVAPWRDHRQQRGRDGFVRMVKPGIRLMAHGVPARMALLGAIGNAIVPHAAAEVMRAYLGVCPG